MPYSFVSAFAFDSERGTLLVPTMTSLKDCLSNWLTGDSGIPRPSAERCASDYSKELEQHMKLTEAYREGCDDGYASSAMLDGYDEAVEKMLRFLRGEKFDG